MKRCIFSLAVFFFCLLFVSCSDTDNSHDDISENEPITSLTGNWQWIRSTGSIAGITVTPQNSGRTMEIEFTADGIFNKYVDNQLVYTSPFVLSEKDSTIQYTTLALFESVGLGFDHQIEQQYSISKDNTLSLIDPCCDNFTFEFVSK
ncbi:MAG: hypothetical protein KJN76_01275 [Eudoraea sp.]|nr:hypothetical protein [Eudoraea sp.]